jgi:hypothetical protein
MLGRNSINQLDVVHRVKFGRRVLVRSTPTIRPREVLSKKGSDDQLPC